MENNLPKVSVIIPVYNDKERLEKCLETLDKQTYSKDLYEVIVVDNASNIDLSESVKKYKQAKLVYEAKPGSYAARNKGLEYATGKIIAFTDSDCIPEPDWIENGVSVINQSPNCGLVGGEIELFFNDPDNPTGIEIYESLTGFPQKEYIEKSNFGATANVFTFRAVFESVGYFNSELKSGGDSEWGKRVAAAGYSLYYAENVLVKHPARASYTEMHKKITRVMSGLPHIREPQIESLIVIIGRFINGAIPPVKNIRIALKKVKKRTLKQKVTLVIVMLYVHYLWVFERMRMHMKSGRFSYF